MREAGGILLTLLCAMNPVDFQSFRQGTNREIDIPAVSYRNRRETTKSGGQEHIPTRPTRVRTRSGIELSTPATNEAGVVRNVARNRSFVKAGHTDRGSMMHLLSSGEPTRHQRET